MDNFFKKHSGNFDEDLAMDYIVRQMSNYQQERGGSSGGQSTRHQDEGDYNYRKLATIYEMIEDFFESKGLEPREFIDNQRRGNR